MNIKKSKNNKNSDAAGPVALITGGSRGIGLGMALELAGAGFNLVINGVREEEQVTPVLKKLKESGTNVIYIQGDVSKSTDRQKIYETALSHFDKINVLINNAGVAPRERKDILEASEDIFDEVLNINLKGPYFLTRLFAGHMIEVKKENPGFRCCIINVSSVSATVPSVNRGEYCISKAGIAMATKLWAARLGEFDIPVYEIRPGIIKTDMTSGVIEKYDKLFSEGINLQNRWGLPEDVGKAALAMATGMLSYSTGQVIMVDGGMTIQKL